MALRTRGRDPPPPGWGFVGRCVGKGRVGSIVGGRARVEVRPDLDPINIRLGWFRPWEVVSTLAVGLLGLQPHRVQP